MLEKKLLEEVNRYKSINKYAANLLNEQAVPPAPPAGDEPGATPPAEDAPAPGLGGDVPPAGEAAPEATDMPPATGATEDNSTEEVDITDLVNMTKNIKKELETNKTDNSGVISKMDDVFNKITELEGKLGEMDNIIAKIDQLGVKIEEMKPKSPVEKLEMRSLDSYPFNEKPDQFFTQKQAEMQASGKNEYVLTKDDVTNYSRDQIAKTFTPNQDDEYEARY
jgi:hypothetical protein